MMNLVLTAGLGILVATPSGGGTDLETFRRLQETLIQVSDKVKGTVVHIEAIQKQNDRNIKVQGSGLILDHDGYVLTNEHIVDKADKALITILGRKKEYEAEILGKDNQTDLALLRIKLAGDEGLRFLVLADSDQVRVGEWVLAVGNPYGLDGTVSFGVISAKGRNVMSNLLNEFIQTDAMIDFGSSGGPLVNLEGKVLGINSIAQGRGIGFTIPINTAVDVIKKLKDSGKIERGWLGVSMQPMSRDLARNMGSPDATGVIVNGVYDESPAAKAGLRPGDAILRFDGQGVDAEKEEDLNEFRRLVARTPVGRRAGMDILREGKALTLQAVVGLQPEMDPDEVDTDYDFKVKAITPHMVRDYMLLQKSGVIVSFVNPGGYVASEAGVLPGDVLLQFGGEPLPDVAAFKAALAKHKKDQEILVRVQRGLDQNFLVLKPGQVGGSEKDKDKP